MTRFKYSIHNLLGHPIMEIFNILGFKKLSIWVHDITLPSDWQTDYDNSWDAGEETNI